MAAPKPPTRQIKRGNGHSYLLDGEPVPGVTTLLGKGIPKPALIDWAARTTAGYAVDHWDDLDGMPPSKRLEVLGKARWESNDEAKVRGTAVHTIAHRLALGEEVDVPEPLLGHVDALQAFYRDFDVEDLLVEAVIVKRGRWGAYMGQLDLIAILHGLAGGPTCLIDLKTGKSGIFPETALQLAAYGDADGYVDGEGVEHPLPPVDRLMALWLRADGYDLIPCDVAGPDELDPKVVFAYAAMIARFQDAPRGTYVGDAIQPPVREEVEA